MSLSRVPPPSQHVNKVRAMPCAMQHPSKSTLSKILQHTQELVGMACLAVRQKGGTASMGRAKKASTRLQVCSGCCTRKAGVGGGKGSNVPPRPVTVHSVINA